MRKATAMEAYRLKLCVFFNSNIRACSENYALFERIKCIGDLNIYLDFGIMEMNLLLLPSVII